MMAERSDVMPFHEIRILRVYMSLYISTHW